MICLASVKKNLWRGIVEATIGPHQD